ncbi:hypothetical protein ACHAWF_003348 [Thalassiosira exigua]
MARICDLLTYTDDKELTDAHIAIWCDNEAIIKYISPTLSPTLSGPPERYSSTNLKEYFNTYLGTRMTTPPTSSCPSKSS